MRRWRLLLPIGVVFVANLFVLTRVATNRSGSPEARLELTERELHLDLPGDENTGLVLRLIARHIGFDDPWPDRSKLAELGFDTRLDPGDPSARSRYIRVPAKQAFVALEYRVGEAEERLIAVDVARDADTLRQRYPDSQRFIVTGCVVRPRFGKDRQPAGYIELLVSEVHVPLPYSRTLSGLTKTPEDAGNFKPRYKVTLCYGRNYEPWICACELMRGGGS